MNRRIIIYAALLGGLAVMLGALGAHALKDLLEEKSLLSFNTGVRYQALHAIALLVIGFSDKEFRFKSLVFRLWLWGTLLFSFSIYLLSTTEISGLALNFLGPITPIGGILLIGGWIMLAASQLRSTELAKPQKK
jgi:uncharacterized membrane protein YgdD (TMEM256/DUF423 family)